ncbi:MAG: PilZ domain-containing protein [Deltaproteobacteria bacterium]|nr:PilZ domain-containing protein [Deltaproteobacteria bacterium]
MLRIPCPKCGTYVFISDAGSFIPCPQCGAIFSGKHGPDKRKEPRTPKKINFSLSLGDRTYKASASDLSASGVGIKVFGRPPLARGEILTLPIKRPIMQAKVVWVKRLPDQSLAGLQKV